MNDTVDNNDYYAEETDWFCPFCGEHDVFIIEANGDYYIGQAHQCYSCDFKFWIPAYRISDEYQ